MATQLEWLAERYDFASWRDVPARASRQEEPFIWHFALFGREIVGWTAHRIQRVTLPSGVSANYSIWRPNTGETNSLLAVDAFELTSREEARAYLLELLGEFQGPPLSRRDAPGAVAFATDDTALVFVRANVVFFVRSAERVPAPVGAVARQLDLYLSARPTAGATGTQEVRALRTGPERPALGKPIPLVAEVVEPDRRAVWYKLFAASGELRVDGDQLVYIAAAAGPQEIAIFAIGPDGGVTTQTLRLDVTD